MYYVWYTLSATVARDLARYKLDLVGAQVRISKGGAVRAWGLYFLLCKNIKINCEQFIFYQGILSPTKRV